VLTRIGALLALAVVVALGACGGGEGGGGRDSAGNELSRRVRAVLTQDPTLVDGLEVEDVTCPNVTEPAVGDRATCIVHLDGLAPRVEVDIEFTEGVAFDVVAVMP
jgi:Domain of unknown function (DUF4333)